MMVVGSTIDDVVTVQAPSPSSSELDTPSHSSGKVTIEISYYNSYHRPDINLRIAL